MTQPPVRKQPGIPIWVWILVLIVVIAALWWILAADERSTGVPEEPLTGEPVLEDVPPATGVGYGTDTGFATGTEFGTEPVEEPQPPPP